MKIEISNVNGTVHVEVPTGYGWSHYWCAEDDILRIMKFLRNRAPKNRCEWVTKFMFWILYRITVPVSSYGHDLLYFLREAR